MNEKPWREAVELAEHYKATGDTNLHLFDRKESDRPWEHVTRIEPGGSYRMDICTNIRIHADHPCGLAFEWYVDIEKREANGSSTYQIDMDTLLSVLERVPAIVRPQLRQHLRTISETITKHAAEQQSWVDKQRLQAEALYRISTAEVPQ